MRGGETVKIQDPERIGRKLRDLRGDKSCQEVADALELTRVAISQYERGERVPRDDIKVKIAEYYGQTVQDIFFSS